MVREYKKIRAFDLKVGDRFCQNKRYFRVVKSNPVNVTYLPSPSLPIDRIRKVRKDSISKLYLVIDS